MIMEEKMVTTKTFYFKIVWTKEIDENWKLEIKFIIKSNEYLAENTIKTKSEQTFSKYKHRNNIHENRKQQNEWGI